MSKRKKSPLVKALKKRLAKFSKIAPGAIAVVAFFYIVYQIYLLTNISRLFK